MKSSAVSIAIFSLDFQR